MLKRPEGQSVEFQFLFVSENSPIITDPIHNTGFYSGNFVNAVFIGCIDGQLCFIE